MSRQYFKIRFTNGADFTPAIILPADQVHGASTKQLAGYFPMADILRMQSLEVSQPFNSFDEAFRG